MPVRSFFLDHLWLKTFSLVLAMLIWLTIRANLDHDVHEETKTFDNEPVALLADSSEHRAFLLDPARVSITVKGPKPVIDSLKDIRAFVELSSHAGNTGNYRVEVQATAGITVMLITPKTVFVRQVADGK
jgi:YbbR domain-containing protein